MTPIHAKIILGAAELNCQGTDREAQSRFGLLRSHSEVAFLLSRVPLKEFDHLRQLRTVTWSARAGKSRFRQLRRLAGLLF